jgi:elongation factor G
MYDDELMEKYFSGEKITSDDMLRCPTQGRPFITGLVPVLCGSSYKNKGCTAAFRCG